MSFNESILSKISSPQDLKKIDISQLEPLCEEIRELLIDTLSKSGGHLSSNLGTVELTVAIHRVFDSPNDQIIWDVGHQAYTHKLLTGRKDRFNTIRTKGGLSGFPSPKESEHDIVVSGHSSTSLASAFGLARANSILGIPNNVVAVVGDGAAGGGMFYEGINNIGRFHDRLIVILNDNKISISKNNGGFSKYLSEIRVRPKYFKTKDKLERFIVNIPFIGKWLKNKIITSKSMLKYALYHTTWFEEFGFKYLGPVNGHDVHSLCDVLSRAKSLNRPVFVHVETIKGKGYKHAEDNPGAYHGVKPFDKNEGYIENITCDGYSKAFGDEIVNLAQKNDKISAITCAMKYATGLDKFANKFPRRFIDVGIAEEFAVTSAAGMAKNGLIPVVAIYSTFLQRAYDQLIHDAAIDNLHIVLAIDRAGISGEDGETHQGIFDVAFLSNIPNTTIYSPSNIDEQIKCLNKAIFDTKGIAAVRYPKGKPSEIPIRFLNFVDDFSLYKSTYNKSNTLLITYGRLYEQCALAVDMLEKDGNGADILKLVNITDTEKVIDIIKNYNNVIFYEEGINRGSVSEKIGASLSFAGFNGKYSTHCIDNQFVPHQSVNEAFKQYGFDAENIYKSLK